ncbi:bacillithiol biosynthesis cysteine-adding enzyme BshC [Cohnella endophytica]|uniref:bacillithiol biosynthesis cysteine-adding enzyme BshC n=1 Tax=Cohnella endophytica TaxID=2419778 RepID=UPI001313E8B0|nr:bacillithiol biosynthesis cysteine-adding enzyme BshC [Cohnella endophytica]
MNITSLHEPNRSSIAERYRIGDPAVLQLFGQHPSEDRHWEERAARLDRSASSRANLKEVANALRLYQGQLPHYEEVTRSLEKLEQPGSLVVVGGQQAGLFGGALLIYYKALSVIQSAKDAERKLGRPVVPIFWIAGEDHDFDEANHVNIQSAGGGIRRIRIERPEGPRLAVSRTTLSTAQWEASLLELASQLPDSEFKPALLERLRSHVADAPSLSLAFARLLADWFGNQGLVLLDADDARLRSLESPMFRELVVRNDELEASLKAGEEQVQSHGFALQAETAEGGANLFLHHEQGRLLLHKEQGRFVDRRGNVALSSEQLLEMTGSSPDLLSTNALTRPLMQDYVLPVLAAVLGPSEIAYWGILGPAFEAFGMSMPILVPRQSFTYLEPTITKLLDKYSLTPEQAIADWSERKAEWLSRQDKWHLEEQFQDVKSRFMALYEPIMNTVSSLQPGLAMLAASNRDKIVQQISFLESRSVDAIAKQHEASLKQWDRIRSSLCPMDKPQERVYGTIHYWNRYGADWLAIWANVPFDVTGGQRLVEGLAVSAH